MSGHILIFSSTSGIAGKVAEELLARGKEVILCGRSGEALERQAADLGVRFSRAVPCFQWDLLDHAAHVGRMQDLVSRWRIAGIVMAGGVMFSQEECEKDPRKLQLTLDTNFTGVALVLNCFAAHFQASKTGFISCISSVAGDRGRGSNFAYGASKAGLTAYLQGLRNRLHGSGILVQTVKPGQVRTAMTAGMKPSLLMAKPEKVAKDIVDAIEARKDQIYTPFYWKYIMCVIKSIPEGLFKRLKL